MPRRIPAILAALLLATPALAQEAKTAPAEPLILLPETEATDATVQTLPDPRPASGSRCSRSKAVTS